MPTKSMTAFPMLAAENCTARTGTCNAPTITAFPRLNREPPSCFIAFQTSDQDPWNVISLQKATASLPKSDTACINASFTFVKYSPIALMVLTARSQTALAADTTNFTVATMNLPTSIRNAFTAGGQCLSSQSATALKILPKSSFKG